MTVINGIAYRTVSEGCADWLQKQVDKKLTGTAWHTSGKKAVKWLRANPIAYEVNPDGTYTVTMPSASEPGREYVATSHECDCTGNARHGHCYHRMTARLLERVDTYEIAEAKHHAEQAKRVVLQVVSPTGSAAWMAAYDGQFIGLAYQFEEAHEMIKTWLAHREWVAEAIHAQQAQQAA